MAHPNSSFCSRTLTAANERLARVEQIKRYAGDIRELYAKA